MSEIKASLRVVLSTTGVGEIDAASNALKGLEAQAGRVTRSRAANTNAATKGAAQMEKAAAREVASAEKKAAREVASIRTVETEMARLTKAQERRELTTQARKNLGIDTRGDFLQGHGFTNRLRSGLGAMRDVAAAAWGLQMGFHAIAGSVGVVLDPLREFQSSMADLRNKGGFDKATTDRIGQMAKDLGKTSQFSPTQAAHAGVELAAAGLNAEGIQTALPSTLRFSQASGMETAASAGLLVETMSQFGLQAKDFEHIGDIMVKAANMSTISVADLGESLKYAGPIARAAGIDLEFTAGTLALLGENGLKGSMGGTAMRKMMDSLVHPAKTAKPALAALGLTADDLKKGLKDMPAFFELLQSKMAKKHMDKAHQLEVGKLLFGEEGIAAAQILMTKALDHGSNGWRAYVEQVRSGAGAMQAAADITANTLDGKMAHLNATLETTKITLGEKFVPMLDKAIPKMADMATVAGDWIGKNGDLILGLTKIGAIAGAAVLAFKGLNLITGGGASGLLSFETLGASAGTSWGSAFAGASIAALAGWEIGSAIAKHFDFAGEDSAGTSSGARGMGGNVDGTQAQSVAEAVAARRAKDHPIAGYRVDKSAADNFVGSLDINIRADGRPEVTGMRASGAPLRVGANVAR